ncbi:hypothetical protein FRUB_02838 [Fimbriiglobus ruber]|uniref:Uncharacterized protein n=1 Tax=Fimbriiglobus ruber TaxID=1908690 RepID=A0A225E173_9BACT|nr:hypothetical protein FRUB_02838 [Fimbriiglobus ruber]
MNADKRGSEQGADLETPDSILNFAPIGMWWEITKSTAETSQ